MANNIHIKPVSKLTRNVASRDIVDKCNEILLSIQEDIKGALENCDTFLIYELPTTFGIENYTSQRAQRHIYFHLLKALQEAEYIVKIEFRGTSSTSQRVFLHINWMTPEQKLKEAEMDSFIISKVIQKK